MRRVKFRVINGAPCPDDIAPFVYVVLHTAQQTAASIYRGDDPAATRILNAHGKHTQAQIYNASPAEREAWGILGQPNRPGFSQHELRDANGNRIPTWEIGVDSGSNTEHDREQIEAAARHHGWRVRHPYSSGVEYHHWCFAARPRVYTPARIRRIHEIRKSLPTR